MSTYFQRYGVTIKTLTESDLEMVRNWRNSPEIAQHMLDQSYITADMQRKWFNGLVNDNSRAYWVAWFKGEPIGVVSLVNINRSEGTAEPGMYIYPQQYRNNIVPFCVAFILNDYAFDELGLSLLYGKIFTDNEASVRFHEKCGYVQVNERKPSHEMTNVPKQLLHYELKEANYKSARDPIARFIRY
ncbi:UDP-4-amino-4,6-dideoxy-N-acetyl-beta-L-altrosamine N-acetyltransferase [Aliidiomarina quisquiliarum]|uniref:UDP-4-amino-4, 6-dideoxy-N-acetyl-beta-L-altrosamine N-acetyltransferase n=1 Tax=Aliidiomarina quisquiliarum TaxID=2938947 RepID=UPI00208E18DC|nr:UDP-4-amino-4,6-dideoxy-N-acetyl-beta-L-altrosamine N-acetyltransferase [Aliidiomarina quisquiliarum]MCO4319928.1 UDP-4-amino-4,6-dideoxy-N-acetyl-beta-L-altrosamine N-acetyltransferase [Aliidiomarina quisquiliarum]